VKRTIEEPKNTHYIGRAMGTGTIMALVGLTIFALGYKFYGKFLATHVYRTEAGDDIEMPSVRINDGVDYVPTNRHILFGHHYVSIAGAAPIVGPALAVAWGWFPAFLWVVLGTVFMGAVHDYGALAISARNGGSTVGELCGRAIGPRVRIAFLIILVILAWVVLAVFALVIAKLFIAYKAAVLAVNFEIVIALVMGWLYYKKGMKLLIPSIIAVGLLYVMIYWGTTIDPNYLSLPGLFGESGVIVDGHVNGAANPAANAAFLPPLALWIILLLVYAFVASILPVWMLLQPRDYINSHQLFIGLGLVYLGIFVANPDASADAIRTSVPGGPDIFPLLFITIACGAISGFHGLVGSGTTSKQIRVLEDARPIGYGGMVGEGVLALAAVIATTCGLANSNLWHYHYYRDWGTANAGKLGAFVEGCGYFLERLALPGDFSKAVVAVLVISFAATTLDSATRIQRYILGEFFESLKIPKLAGNALFCAALAAGGAVLLAFSQNKGAGGMIFWPIFGASNQMIAAVTLLLLTVWLVKTKRTVWPVAIPMVFVGVITLISMAANTAQFLAAGRDVQVPVAGFVLQGGVPVRGEVPDPVPPVTVATIAPGGAAEAAGLRAGDRVIQVRPQPATTSLNDPGLPLFRWDEPACVDAVPWAEGTLHAGDTLMVHRAGPEGREEVVAVVLGARATRTERNWFLGLLSLLIALLDVWIIAESVIVLRRVFAERKANPDADLSGGLR
jgi:carbon starvation protein